MPTLPAGALPWWKRTIDLLCCLVACPAFFVLVLLVGLVMAVTSPGHIFFRQERVGLHGRRFKIFKFRTMQMGTETKAHQEHFSHLMRSNAPMEKLDTKGDSRLIAGGWILRATGLDELPQIVNVWRGEMSIVGPRPGIPYEFERYTAVQRERVLSLPGLTGLWQVSGKNRTTFEQMIQLDRDYLRRRSLGFDLRIMALTLPALGLQVWDTLKSRWYGRSFLPAAGERAPR